jgi:TonB family protein
MLKQAADSLDSYLKLNPRLAEIGLWRGQLEALHFYAGIKSDPTLANPVPSEGAIEKPRIQSKPEPDYTDAARNARLEGTVELSAILASDGTVKHILVLRPLPLGLTEKAVEAARRIKFIPATKGRRPLSMYYRIQYNFKLP